MTLTKVVEQTTQKIFQMQTCSKSIIRISEERGYVASVSKLLLLNKLVCGATSEIYAMYVNTFEHITFLWQFC